MPESITCSQDEAQLAERIMDSLEGDLALMLDQEVRLDVDTVERLYRRPVGEGTIHISFKLDFWLGGNADQGCLLMPLPDAISVAGLMLGAVAATIETQRDALALDATQKTAMVEVGNLICEGIGSALRVMSLPHEVRFAGCQGVRAGVRPALFYRENEPLTVARTTMALAEFPPSEVILVLPVLA